jgi:anti-sigma-K factor RskA
MSAGFAHDWFIEHRQAFVARHLEADEMRAFEEHLRGCADCRTAVATVERELAWLAMGVRPVEPRPGLRRELAEAVLAPPAARWRRWTPLAAAAAAALVLGLGWRASAARARSLAGELAAARGELAAVEDTLSVLRRTSRVFHAPVTMHEHRGTLTILEDPVTHRWQVVIAGLPPAPAGERYQFWFICEDGMVRGAEIAPGDNRAAALTLGMPARGGAVLGASLTMEPEGDVDGPPKGMELAHLMLES